MTKSTLQFMGYPNQHAYTIAALILIVTFGTTAADQSLLSEQCKNENIALASNQALQAAAPNIECNIYVDINERCTADFADMSDQFRDLCLDAGGQFFTTDVTFDGTTVLSGVTYNTDYSYLNFPACVGASCSVSEIKAAFDNVAIPYLEQSIESDGFAGQANSENELLTDGGDKTPNLDNGSSDACTNILNRKNMGIIFSVFGLIVGSLTVIVM